jgi:hypothetical protein
MTDSARVEFISAGLRVAPALSTPYTRGERVFGAPQRNCFYCGRVLRFSHVPGSEKSHRRKTRDHILARAFGKAPPEVVSTRPCCRGCNQLRADLGHCVGALMLAVIEGQHRQIGKENAAVVLGMKLSRKDIAAASQARRLARRKERRESARLTREATGA